MANTGAADDGESGKQEAPAFAALEAQVAALQQLLEVQDRTVISQSRRLQSLSEDRAHLLLAAIDVAERERSTIADAIHDGPVQRLTALSYAIERIGKRIEKEEWTDLPVLVSTVTASVRNEIGSLRELMSNLRPPALDQSGVVAAIKDYVAAFGVKNGLSATVTSDIGSELPTEVQTILFRVTQEALTNISKHSDASSVRIEIGMSGDTKVRLAITDNGKGMALPEIESAVREGRFGIAGMRERVEGAGGTFRFASTPGDGTELTVLLPSTASN